MANPLAAGKLRTAMPANIAGHHMQITDQVFDKRGISSRAKSIGMQQVGLQPGPAPVQVMDFAVRDINEVFNWFVIFRGIHTLKL